MELICLNTYCDDLRWRGTAPRVPFSFDEARSAMGKLRGSFSVVSCKNDCVILASDAIASIPLFYAIGEAEVVVSDSAESIANYIGAPLDDTAINELLHSGYVIGGGTLYESVSYVLPGECVRISLKSGRISKVRWYELDYCNNMAESGSTTQSFDEVCSRVFEDLIERLDGRQVVVPLSGGCDSRIVVTWLKRLGYEHVLCMSYGRANSWESQKSERIAKSLGYPWRKVEYDGDRWRSFYRLEDYERFLRFAGRGHTIGCVQALPATLSLVESGCIEREAVVVPGHALDFAFGSHLPRINEGEEWSLNQLRRFLTESHFSLSRGGREINPLRDSGCNEARLSRDEAAQLIMRWEWENRQTKFIANDVRAYEFAGLGFELPFWDIRICDFSQSLSYGQLYGRQFQYAYMSEFIDPLAGVQETYEVQATGRGAFKGFAKSALLRLNVIREANMLGKQHADANAFYEHMTSTEWRRNVLHYGSGFNMNSIVASDYVNFLKSDSAEGR